MKKKSFVMALALVLVFAVAVGGVVAWLTDKTAPVTNTFTIGDINITLTETTGNSYKIVPGDTKAKDPTVTVKANSEECYLFVKVDAAYNTVDGKQIVNYAVDTAKWKALDGQAGVYYMVVDASNADQSFCVLTGGEKNASGQVTINTNLTKSEVNSINANQPTLTFTAYAVQKDNVANATDAWELVK